MTRLSLLTLLLGLLISFNTQAETFTQSYKFEEPGIIKAYDDYIELSFADCLNFGDEGAPLLPYYGAALLLPQGEEITSVRIISAEYSDFWENIRIVPASRQFPISKPAPENYKPMPDILVYNSNQAYPQENISQISTHFLAGFSIASFNLCPVIYFPAQNKIKYLTSVTVEIETKPSVKIIRQPAIHSNKTLIEKRISAIVDNPEKTATYFFPLFRDDDEYDMLFITRNSFVSCFEEYIQYKTSTGFMVKVVTTEEIFSSYTGVDNQEKIRNCIIDYYENTGISFVILGGDADPTNANDKIIPHRGFYVNTGYETENDLPSDMYYACLDGNWNDDNDNKWGEPGEEDIYAEVSIGRICADNVSEFANALNKLILYQDNPVIEDIEKALMIGEELDASTFGGNYKNEVAEGSSNFGYTTVGVSDNFTVTRLYEMLGYWNKNDVFEEFSQNGCHLLNHLGHSSVGYNMKMYNSDLTTYNFQNDGITRGYVIGYSQGCYNGAFDNRNSSGSYGSDCFAEKITTIETAEVASIGNSRYGWYMQGNTNDASQYFDRQFYDAVFGENITLIGTANGDSKEDGASYIMANKVFRWCAYETTLFGDPSMDIWTAQPEDINASYLAAIPFGLGTMDVTTDAPFARIGFVQDGQLIGRAIADENGNCTINFFEPVSSVEPINLSIIAHNKNRLQATITVIGDQPYVVFEHYEINDSGGNNNGEPDFGETIQLGIGLTNLGNVAAENVIVNLSSADPYITLPYLAVDFGDFDPGETIFIEDAFSVIIASNIPDQHQIIITVNANGQETWTSDFSMIANAPDLIIGAMTIDDAAGGNGNGILDPGEIAGLSVPLVNDGHCTSPDIFSTLSSPNTFVNITSANSNISGLQQFENGTLYFEIEIAHEANIGDVAELLLELTSGDYEFEKTFEQKIGLILEDFETGNFSQFDWEFEGNQPWEIYASNSYEGIYCIKSGEINNNQSSEVKISVLVTASDSISFYLKVSSQANSDFLEFYIDSQKKGQWAGEKSWQRVSFPVSSGQHTFRWVYDKNNYGSNGEDCAWIDYLIFPPIVRTTVYAGPDDEICEGENYILQATASNYTDINWTTSGTGAFDDNTILNPVYTTGQDDISTGSVILTITVTGSGNEIVSDNMTLSILELPSVPDQPMGDVEPCTNYGTTYQYHTNTVQSADYYIWELLPDEAGTISGTGRNVSVVWTPDYVGTVFIHVKAVNDCGESDFSESLEVQAEICTGINENTLAKTEILPNPNNGIFEIKLSGFTADVNICICNALGQKVFKKVIRKENISNTCSIDLSNRKNGIYYLTATDKSGIVKAKILIN